MTFHYNHELRVSSRWKIAFLKKKKPHAGSGKFQLAEARNPNHFRSFVAIVTQLRNISSALQYLQRVFPPSWENVEKLFLISHAINYTFVWLDLLCRVLLSMQVQQHASKIHSSESDKQSALRQIRTKKNKNSIPPRSKISRVLPN